MNYIRSLSTKQLAVLGLIFANIIWGAASPIFKWALEDIPLFMLAYFRFFGASLLILPLVYKRDLSIQKHDWPKLILLSLFGITINIIFFFLGLEKAPSINAPIIASSGPIILIAASILLLHERPSRKTILGALISLLGVVIIIGRPLLENGFDFSSVEGNVFFLLATIAAVGHTICFKQMDEKYSTLVITFWSFIIGSLTFFPLFASELYKSGMPVLDIRGWTGLIFGIFLSSTIAYVLWGWSLKRITASETGLFSYVDPVIATVIAIPLLGEVITPLFIVGSFFVFAGIFYAEGRIHYHPFHKLRA